MDLSLSSGLDLSVKNNDYNDNKISVHQYPNKYNYQSTFYSNYEVNIQPITSPDHENSSFTNNTVGLDHIQVKDEQNESMNMYQQHDNYFGNAHDSLKEVNGDPMDEKDEINSSKEESIAKEESIEMINMQPQYVPYFNNTLNNRKEVREESIDEKDELNFITKEPFEMIDMQKQKEVKVDPINESDGLIQDQIKEEKISNSEHPQYSNDRLQSPEVTHLSNSTEEKVKVEPSFENYNTSSLFEHEIPPPSNANNWPPPQNANNWPPPSNANNWHQYWNGYQSTLGSNTEYYHNMKTEPGIGKEYHHSYGQQTPFGHFQQFYGSVPHNQHFSQPAQHSVPQYQTNLQSYPWIPHNGVHPNFLQPYYNSSMWNGYPFQYGGQINGQYGPNPCVQKSSPGENDVKVELNYSNEATSDLGSSFDNSEDSFSSPDVDIKSTPKFRSHEELLWVYDEKILPKGWKKRIYKSGKILHHNFFMSPANEKFTSKSSVLEYMDRFPLIYTKEDKEKLKSTEDPFNWIEDETLLPIGWKKRVYKNGKPMRHHVFLSPENEKFTSKTALLEYMNEYPSLFNENDKDKLKVTEDPFNWVPDETLLPTGWKKRVYKNGKPMRHHVFLSPENEKFTSKTALLEYMDKNPSLFSEHDIGKLKSTEDLFNWVPDETLLPNGWKKRVYKNGKPTNHYVFLSPTNEKFTSKTELLEYMDKNPSLFSRPDVDKLRSTLRSKLTSTMYSGKKKYSDWDSSDPTLPPGWLKRHYEYRSSKSISGRLYRDYQYMSPNQEIFISRNAVMAHMRQNAYAEEDIQLVLSGKLRSGPKNGIFLSKINSDGLVRDYTKWDDSDATLPKGWLKRHSVYHDPSGRKHIEYQYLSPDKKKFISRNAVVAFMMKSRQYSQDEIELVLSGKMRGKTKGRSLG